MSKSGKFWIFLFSHQNFSKTWGRVTFKLIQYIKNCLKNNMYDFWKDMIIVSREKKCLVVKNGLFLAIFIYFLFWPPKKPFSMPISKKSQECFLLDNKKVVTKFLVKLVKNCFFLFFTIFWNLKFCYFLFFNFFNFAGP